MSKLASISMLALVAASVPLAALADVNRPSCDASLSERLRAGGCDSVAFTELEFMPRYQRDQSEPAPPEATEPAPEPAPPAPPLL